MAQYKYEGYDEVIRQADSAGAEMHRRMERAAHLAAEELIRALKDEERNTFKAPTGEMGRILEETPVYTVSSDYTEAVVYPGGDYTGIRGRPRRAATIAFVLENGRPEHVDPNPWNARAARKARKRIDGIIEQTLRGDST